MLKEMPVLTAARFMEVTYNRLWRIIAYYVNRAIQRLDFAVYEEYLKKNSTANDSQEIRKQIDSMRAELADIRKNATP